MEGIYFYWFSWMIWVFSTFMMEKGFYRFFSGLAMLVIIIFSNQYISFFRYEVNIAYLFILIFSFFYLATSKGLERMYYLFTALIISFAYVGLSLLVLYDPVWIIFDYRWMISIIVASLTITLIKNHKMRYVSLSIGICQGEWLYLIVLKDYFFINRLGSIEFLDVFAIVLIITLTWNIMEMSFKRYQSKYIKERKVGIHG